VTAVWVADDVRTKDRVWLATAFAVVIANLVLAGVEIHRYSNAYDGCTGGVPENLDCRSRVVDTMDDSNTWMMIASIPLLLSLFLPLRPSTTPWRTACVAVLALSFVVRLILMQTH
jgi:hypothetical protein